MKPIQPEPGGDNSITALPRRLSEDERAVEAVPIRQNYPECRQLAARHLRNQRGSRALLPRAPVHEARMQPAQRPHIL
jgi:hypothetical protein